MKNIEFYHILHIVGVSLNNTIITEKKRSALGYNL